jgi:transcriptional regulator with XRE-family HTH domain
MNSLASLVGVPPSTISRIESGKIEPTFQLVLRITNALGFSVGNVIEESGSDVPFVKFLDSLPVDYNIQQFASKFASVAQLAPIAKRAGAKRFEVSENLQLIVNGLLAEGESPIVSSLEAFNKSIRVTSSFIPVIYVDCPNLIKSLVPPTKTSKQIMFLLQTTPAVRQQTRVSEGIDMVSPAWGILDALASPGRQPDATLEAIGQKSIVVA